MRPSTTSSSAQAVAESVRAQLGTDAVVLILPGSPACAVVIATDTSLASTLLNDAKAGASQAASGSGTVQQDGQRLAYSVDEAARALGVSRDVIYHELRTGRLKSIKVGRRRIIGRHHIEDFLAGR